MCIKNSYLVRCCILYYIGMIKTISIVLLFWNLRKVNTTMSRAKKGSNVEIGIRLRIIRENLGKSQEEFAEILNVTDDHYRKIESGSTGLTLEKVRILYEKLNIDPTFLLTGEQMEEFDLDKYLVNCSKEQRANLLKRCLEYISAYITR